MTPTIVTERSMTRAQSGCRRECGPCAAPGQPTVALALSGPAAADAIAGKSATRIRKLRRAGAGPWVPPACGLLRAPVYLTPFGSRRSPAWPTSSNNLPPCLSGATRQAVPRSPALALPGRRWPYSPRLKKKLANKWARN